MKTLFAVLITFCLSTMAYADWQDLEPGLELGYFNGYWDPDIGDSRIKILRINPAYFQLVLLNTSAQEEDVLYTAKEWAQNNQLVAAINASMYRQDFKTSVSYMRTDKHVNNPYLSHDKTILAFGKKSETEVSEFMLIDRQCESFDEWKRHYTSFVQSIRMISCKGKNVWKPRSQKWSIAALAVDDQGNLLFIHSRLPYSTHDFINHLMALPLNIKRAMYSEGGSEAQLFIESNGQEYEFLGVSEDYSPGITLQLKASPIPNVIGIRRKDRPNAD